MSIVLAVLFVAVFISAFLTFGANNAARMLGDSVVESAMVLFDNTYDDVQKERIIKNSAFDLIKNSVKLLLVLFVSLILALIPILISDFIGLASAHQSLNVIVSVEFVFSITVVFTIWLVFKRYLGVQKKSTSNKYLPIEKLIHNLAFFGTKLMRTAAIFDDKLFPKSREDTGSPIFISTLARGGSTALLNALYAIPNVGSYTYRDMPFVTMPSVWRLMSGGQSRSVLKRRRAHGDGHSINLNSPEAFEEIIWKMFFKEIFSNSTLPILSSEEVTQEFETFFKNQANKVANLSVYQKGGQQNIKNIRYCSKNNANVSRIAFLKKCTQIVK